MPLSKEKRLSRNGAGYLRCCSEWQLLLSASSSDRQTLDIARNAKKKYKETIRKLPEFEKEDRFKRYIYIDERAWYI